MKNIFYIFISFYLFTFNTNAQQNEEDRNTLSIFSEYAKAKNYDAAYKPWMELRKRNPKFNLNIFSQGEKILKYKIKNSTGTEKFDYIQDLLLLYKQRRQNFESKTPLGAYLAKAAKLKYDHREILKISNLDLYNFFDNAFKTDLNSFNNPKIWYFLGSNWRSNGLL